VPVPEAEHVTHDRHHSRRSSEGHACSEPGLPENMRYVTFTEKIQMENCSITIHRN
jgi:hypothetical protein